MKIRIHSHEGAATLHPRRYEVDRAAMIRITTMPAFVPLVFREAYVDVLELRFADITKEGWAKHIENGSELAKQQLQRQLADGHAFWLMTEDHARQINEFVDKVKDNIDLLVVHCDAGVSRSSAVALAICEKLSLVDEARRIESSPRYHPNYYVRSLVRQQFLPDEERQRLYERLLGERVE